MSDKLDGARKVSPKIVLAVPVFKHSVLVVDALRCLLEQADLAQIRVIIVDDGCPFRETQAVLRAFAQAYPDVFQCVRQENRGLSGARNTAIEIALEQYPDAEGIYLLDSDNILLPWALTRALEVLKAHPEADWFFPDVVSFGVDSICDFAGAYDLFEHLEHNYCEAGSLVRMRVFKAGLRFDEKMKSGYEDWEFWLNAAAAGFRGRHLPDSGFRYRRRGESMLAESDRERESILSYIYKKHRKSFSLQAMLQLESEGHPRIAFIDVGTRTVTYGFDFLQQKGKSLSLEEFAEQLADYPHSNIPSIAVFGSLSNLRALYHANLHQWVLWELEHFALSANVGGCRLLIEPAQSSIWISPEAFAPTAGNIFSMTMWLLRDCARDATGGWIASLAGRETSLTFKPLTVSIPDPKIAGMPVYSSPGVGEYLSVVESLRQMCRQYGDPGPWDIGYQGRRGPAKVSGAYAQWYNLARPFPRAKPKDKINIGFILPMAAFGGVERVAHQTARALRDIGYVPHLIIVGSHNFTLPEDLRDVYASYRFFRGPTSTGGFPWDGSRQFYGTDLGVLEDSRIRELVGLCADLDVVINAHSDTANFAMGPLRRAGILTACTQHVFDHSVFGRLVGHPFLGLAFEHGYDLIMTISQQMTDQLRGLGVPQEKLMLVPNAAGFALDKDDIADAIHERKVRKGNLRCLFMGRLDPQKGLDRLEAIIKLGRARDLPLDWRIVGGGVIDGAGKIEAIAGIAVEPPVYSAEEISSRLAWADVVVMPSRYEGLPLLAIEAMSFGCVVVASDVGANNELITNGVNGFLIPSDTVVEGAVETLAALASDKALCQHVAKTALQDSKSRRWSESVKGLDHWIKDKLAKARAVAVKAQQAARAG